MLSKKLTDIYISIVGEAALMVGKHVDPKDLSGKVDFAAIYAKTEKEYNNISKAIAAEGVLFDAQPTGNYYLLNQPIPTNYGMITKCRIRIPDKKVKQRGYLDFEPKDFESFKRKYLIKKEFSLIKNVHGIELVKLSAPEFTVNAFFPDSFS